MFHSMCEQSWTCNSVHGVCVLFMLCVVHVVCVLLMSCMLCVEVQHICVNVVVVVVVDVCVCVSGCAGACFWLCV